MLTKINPDTYTNVHHLLIFAQLVEMRWLRWQSSGFLLGKPWVKSCSGSNEIDSNLVTCLEHWLQQVINLTLVAKKAMLY